MKKSRFIDIPIPPQDTCEDLTPAEYRVRYHPAIWKWVALIWVCLRFGLNFIDEILFEFSLGDVNPSPLL